jgi:hypothetical protein
MRNDGYSSDAEVRRKTGIAKRTSRARLLADDLLLRHGTGALRYAAEQIELFLCIGDYSSVALWARAGEAIQKIERAAAKPRKPALIEILPPCDSRIEVAG